MRHSSLALLVACAGLSIHLPVQAHGLWTEERRGNIEVIYGHGAEDDAYKAEKISAWAFDKTGRAVPAVIERLQDHARIKPQQPSAYSLVMMDNGLWTQKADKQWVNAPKQQVPGALQSSRAVKYALTIHEPHARIVIPQAVRFAVVPEGDALEAGPGKPLKVQVLLDGKPASGIEVIGDYRGAPHTVSATTDAQGKATIVVRNEGLNVIAAQSKQAVTGDPELDRLSYFASLTFLGEPQHE